MPVSSGERAILVFTSDGSQRYVNAVKYPSTAGPPQQHLISNKLLIVEMLLQIPSQLEDLPQLELLQLIHL